MAQSPAKGLQPLDARNLFGGLAGLFVGMGLLKLGNPIVLDDRIEKPADLTGVLYQVWPVQWGYWLLVAVLAAALGTGRWKRPASWWIPGFLAAWLGWQFVAATQTIDASLTAATLKHFCACGACFLIGWLALAEVPSLTLFWVGVLLAFIAVLQIGFTQHFGGLAATRRYIELYVLPTHAYPPDFLKRIQSERIFSTLFYPNSFAAALLLFLPPLLAMIWRWTVTVSTALRFLAVLAVGGSGVACLVWSGSKAGWLLAMIGGGVVFCRMDLKRGLKIGVVAGLCLAGLTGFFVRYQKFFERGATSVSARYDYWRAAIHVVGEHPGLGTGPGTFSKNYARLKSSESEMARLAHNDFLQQACDSGVPGFVAFFGFFGLILTKLYRESKDVEPFFIGLGVFLLLLHSWVDFDLYVPGLAWPVFLLAGWAAGRAPTNRLDKPGVGF